jgi:hypothetical protein
MVQERDEGNEENRKISHVSFDALIVQMRCGKMRFGGSIDCYGGVVVTLLF